MAVNVYATLKQVLQDFIAPQLEAVKGEIGSVRAEIAAVRAEVTSFRAEMRAEIKRLDEKLTFTNKRLDEALEIRERLAALEAKVGR